MKAEMILTSILLLNLWAAEIQENDLKLFCSCENSVSCLTNGILGKEIDDATKIILNGCEHLEPTDVDELQIFRATKGINRKLEEFTDLLFLKISNSAVKKLSGGMFEGLQRLKTLILIGNEIEELTEIAQLESLQKLFLSRNKVDMIRKNYFIGLRSLSLLTLEDNRIFYVHSEAFAMNENLEEINLNRNDLAVLDEKTFQRNKNLKEISLNHNKIKHLSTQTFSENINLAILRLHGNELTRLQKNLFARNSKLRWIELGGNQLLFIDSNLFANLKQIEFIDFASNDCIDDSFPIEMNLQHMLELIKRNCHHLAVLYLEII